MKNMKIDANGTEIRVMGDVVNEDAYISLTDIAKYKNPDNAFIVVANWMRNHSTISFLGLWEQIHNPNFKPIEFDRFKAESGDNAFTLLYRKDRLRRSFELKMPAGRRATQIDDLGIKKDKNLPH